MPLIELNKKSKQKRYQNIVYFLRKRNIEEELDKHPPTMVHILCVEPESL